MKRILLIAIAASCLAAPRAGASVFTGAEMDEVSCAALKLQLFYYYLDPGREQKILDHTFKCRGRDSRLVMPQWMIDEVAAMSGKPAWRDPEEGELSEAMLWQHTVSILYEFMEISRKTFPPDQGGAAIAPALLVKEYSDMRIRYQMSLDRLYRARLNDSLDGRGRSLLATFSLILKQMESIADAISSADSKAYAEAVTTSAVLSQDAFFQVFEPPRKYEAPKVFSRAEELVFVGATVIGIILVFTAVRLFFMLNEKETDRLVQDYAGRVNRWTDDFSRQFMTVKVHYLVFAPAAVFALLGLLSFNLPIFLLMSALGMYVGLRTPTMVLNSMKRSRGRKIDTQLMDALILMSNCLRSGLDVVQGFEMVSKDLLPPIADEFSLVIKNYQLGMPFEKALGVMEERVESKMLSYMIRAIVLQRQMGGNLTKVFERIVVDIREESKLEEKTKAMTAQQKIQSIVVGIMPWIMVSVMFMFQPETMIKFYGSPLGMMTFIFCAIWIGIGMKVVSSLGKIRV